MIVATLLGFTIILAMTIYLIQFRIIMQRKYQKTFLKDTIGHINSREDIDNVNNVLPSFMYMFLINDDGEVLEHTTNKNSIGLNLKSHEQLKDVYSNMLTRGITGGFTHFDWINAKGEIDTHVGFSKRLDDKNTVILCSEKINLKN